MRVVALAGGVGGAKLADGLAQVLPAEDLTIIVNTGDDFEHLGLRICPDLDTVCYTLAGLANPETGWGRVNETWNVMGGLKSIGGPGWFQLGDKDLSTHLERTRRLGEGQTLSEITNDFCQSWDVFHKILPMSDDWIQTIVDTDFGEMSFQEYYVKNKWQPRVRGFRFEGAETSKPAPGVLEAIMAATHLVICPSNPWVSIDPIFSVPGVKDTIMNQKNKGLSVVAVSPIIGGNAVKGPAAKMYQEMGVEPSAISVGQHYTNIIDCLIFDLVDSDLEKDILRLGIDAIAHQTLMQNSSDRKRFALELLRIK